MVTLQTLEHCSYPEIAEAFNLAFSDYFLPVRLTKEQLRKKYDTEGGDLKMSVGAFSQGQLIGFILHFTDRVEHENLIYNGGTGVIPSYRGNGLTSKMYSFFDKEIEKDSADKMVLEVLVQNEVALTVYQRQGFKIYRELNCFRGELNPIEGIQLEAPFRLANSVQLSPAQMSHMWDHNPTWQHSSTTVSNLQLEISTLSIWKGSDPIAYLIYGKFNNKIYQLAVHPDYRRRGFARILFNHLASIVTGSVSLINVDSRIDGSLELCTYFGLELFCRQYDMERNLT